MREDSLSIRYKNTAARGLGLPVNAHQSTSHLLWALDLLDL